MNDDVTFYWSDPFIFFRLALLGLAVYNLVQFARTLLRFKPYYEKVPDPLKRYLLEKGKPFFGKKLQQHWQDFALNGVLLVIFGILSAIAFLLR